MAAKQNGELSMAEKGEFRVFERALALSGEERERFLAAACGADSALLAEVRALLAADDSARQNGVGEREQTELEHETRRESTASDPALGRDIGPYRLVELIGSGGMGRVYRGVRADSEYHMSVAIKRLKPGFDAAQFVTRFRAERQILANLEHPNIGRLLDGGADHEGLPYPVMEYIEGVPPQVYCDSHSLSTAQRLALFRQICAAVHFAHQHMVVHRDLKPGNILVTKEGVPKLLDFGIAKVLVPEVAGTDPVTETAGTAMTPAYASPEQVRGETVTTASDVYSLGVVLYELLTGHSPYRRLDRPAHELMRAICEEEPEKPSVWRRELRGDVDNIVLKAIRKEPAARYPSADQLSEDVLRHLEGRPVLARGDAFSYLAAKFIRRNKIAVAAAAAVLCTLVGGLIAVSRAHARAERRFNEVRQLAHAVVFDYHDAIEHLPGSTPVRERLVKDALKYLDSLSKEADTPDLQREMVDAYVRISNVQGDAYHDNLGDPAGAMQSARKAVAAAEKLLRTDGSPAAERSAAMAYAAEGSLFYASGDLKSAERLLHRAVELGETVARNQPGDAGNALALSDNLKYLGDLYGGAGMQNLGNTAASVEFYQRAERLGLEMAARFPGDARVTRAHYQTLMSLGAAEASLGHPDAAARDLREALHLLEDLSAKNPNDSLDRLELANASLRTGLLFLDDRKAAEAVPYMARSAGILDQLSAADPRNALYQRSLSVTENHYATALRMAGDPKAALPHNLRSLALAEALSKAGPDSVEYRADAGISHRKLAETLLAVGDVRGALDHASRAATILCESTGSSGDAYLQSHCGRAALATGDAQMGLREPAAAAQSYRRAEEIAAKLSEADPLNTVLRSDLARAELSLGATLARVHRFVEAKDCYRRAMEDWAELRTHQALTAEDAHRADETARGLAAVLAVLPGS